MKDKTEKFLLNNKIKYEVFEYPKNLRNTIKIAQYLNIKSEELYKSIVLLGQNVKILAVLPSNYNINLDRFVLVTGLKNLYIATKEEVYDYTGMKVGEVSPMLLIDKDFKIFIDKSILLLEWVYLSAGKRGYVVKVRTKKLLYTINPMMFDFSK